MTDTVVILLSLQLVLMLVLVVGLFVMGKSAKESLDKAAVLMEKVQNTLESDLKPALIEARSAIGKAEEAATLAASTLTAAAPAVSTVSQLAGAVQKSVSPLWLDAAKLAVGLLVAVRGRKKAKQESIEGESTHGK